MIAADVQNALNEQINEEYCSWYFYRSASARCRQLKLRGFGHWLRRLSGKKLDLATRPSEFGLDRGGQVDSRPISTMNGHWDSPLGIVEAALEREHQLGKLAAWVVNLSLSQGDYASQAFMERVVSDQVETEAKVGTVRDRLKMVGDAPAGLFLVDQDLA